MDEEIVISEMQELMGISIPIPSNFTDCCKYPKVTVKKWQFDDCLKSCAVLYLATDRCW